MKNCTISKKKEKLQVKLEYLEIIKAISHHGRNMVLKEIELRTEIGQKREK